MNTGASPFPSVICHWLVDSQCHTALSSVNNLQLSSISELMNQLVEAASSLYYDSRIMENMDKFLHRADTDCGIEDKHLYRRILLTCIGLRVVVGNESNFIFTLDKNSCPLQGALYLMEKMEFLFDDLETGNLFFQMRLETYKNLVLSKVKKDGISSAKEFVNEIGGTMDETIKKECQKVFDDPSLLSSLYSCYVLAMFKLLAKLNELLPMPFLEKLEQRLKETNAAGTLEASPEEIKCVYAMSDPLERACIKLRKSKQTCLNVLSPGNIFHSAVPDPCSTNDNSYENVSNDGQQTSSTSEEKRTNCHGQDSDVNLEESSHESENIQEFPENIPVSEIENSLPIRKSKTPFNDLESTGSYVPVPPWTMQSDAYIICGIKILGYVNWQEIYKKFPFPTNITQVNLAERWNSLLDNGIVVLGIDQCIIKVHDSLKEYMTLALQMVELQQGAVADTLLNEQSHEQGDTVHHVEAAIDGTNNENKEGTIGDAAQKNLHRSCNARKMENWTVQEDSFILLGIKEFGIKSWMKIRRTFPFSKTRLATSLKFRWNFLIKQGLIKVDANMMLLKFNDCYKEPLKNAITILEKQQKLTSNILALLVQDEVHVVDSPVEKNELNTDIRVSADTSNVTQCSNEKNSVMDGVCEEQKKSSDAKNSVLDYDKSDHIENIELQDVDQNDEEYSTNNNPVLEESSQTISTSVGVRRTWTKQSDAYIVCGVKKFGVGYWAEICKAFPFPRSLCETHVKDRWKMLLEEGSVELNHDKSVKNTHNSLKNYLVKANKIFEKSSVGELAVHHTRSVTRANSNSHATRYNERYKMQSVKRKLPVSNDKAASTSATTNVGRRKWTIKDDTYILLGVIELGIGAWSEIIRKFPFSKSKLPPHIKDRWRNMVKQGLVQVRCATVIKFDQGYVEFLPAAIEIFEEDSILSSAARILFFQHGVELESSVAVEQSSIKKRKKVKRHKRKLLLHISSSEDDHC